ncbi:MAG: histidine--tRNA ligase [Candidatus Yonathbacteria bacterium RIFOXYC1_FULL_52_10]|uniref:Histidine--tRNA ligase n=1 Tax=Candidatus Yonathbacteria bacterium RIFOXYD1_FULL_52_36 TaxID=1802730 RepID=A0A1G2SKJ4_9BACT|nr:MAG: histidine--tRNA ligase [Candidatus Yonathbacteria bacterium RIFOXYC1_FULL_52_10]OHA85595.1 MAG: histidine--tRNA ligase [Candidatus Yonathbacteria bacterium RIFOXYD1_FULL_52_36]
MQQKQPSKKPHAELFTSPKGMRDLIGEEFYKYQGFFDKASEVAVYYGFKPIATPILEREPVFTSSLGVGTDIRDKEMYSLKTKGGDHLVMRPEGTAGVMRAYIEHGMQALPQPVMLYYCGPFFRHENPQHGRLRELRQFGLEILGSTKSIADAIVIRTMTIILEEAGIKNIVVYINSIGDKDCRPAFLRELTNYYKKHADNLCPHCQERLKTNPLRLLDCKDERCEPFKAGAPQSIAFLCSPCRAHFKEVIEYLETMGIPYEMNPFLVRGLDYYTRTVFEIAERLPEGAAAPDERDPGALSVAAGGRYDYLAKFLGSKKDVPGVGGGIGIDRVIMSPRHKPLDPRILKKPKVCFIQLGFEAKLKSLSIIEILRKARIPVVQSLPKDSLSVQLGMAENLNVPYAIIFGQKEAMDGTVIVRDMSSRSQETVKIADLPEYIKKIKPH